MGQLWAKYLIYRNFSRSSQVSTISWVGSWALCKQMLRQNQECKRFRVKGKVEGSRMGRGSCGDNAEVIQSPPAQCGGFQSTDDPRSPSWGGSGLAWVLLPYSTIGQQRTVWPQPPKLRGTLEALITGGCQLSNYTLHCIAQSTTVLLFPLSRWCQGWVYQLRNLPAGA